VKPTETDIPNKRYFRIGEVSAITGLEPYVLRYWQTEFPHINPSRSRSGQRLYKRRDVQTILQIKELLYDRRFTIAGAKQYLRQLQREGPSAEGDSEPLTLGEVRKELLAIRELLKR
jgi:DNA-binding transcriptional MerR regulator